MKKLDRDTKYFENLLFFKKRQSESCRFLIDKLKTELAGASGKNDHFSEICSH